MFSSHGIDYEEVFNGMIFILVVVWIVVLFAWILPSRQVDENEQRRQEQMILMSRLAACDGLDSYTAIKQCLDDVERTTR